MFARVEYLWDCGTDNCNDGVMRVAGRLWVPTMQLKDILKQAKGGSLVESTQIRWFSRWSGGVGWSGRAVAQQMPRVSKLGLSGLSDYYSNEIEVKAARRGARGPKKGATPTEYLLKERELDNSSKPN
jgi:hypothetical protein